MANKDFRTTESGDVNFEGRQSNGFTAKKDGSVVFYGSVLAALPKDVDMLFSEGNNNKETMAKQTENITQPTTPSSTTPNSELPTDENSYISSKFYNSVGNGNDGTGYEGEPYTPEQIEQLINEINNRPYNKL
jgi:hypothetical protein